MLKNFLLLFLFLFISSAIYSAPTSVNDAVNAVRGFLTLDVTPFGESVSNSIESVETHRDSNNTIIYYIVNLHGDGYIVVSSDDLVEPIIAIVQKGRYISTRSKPLGAMLYSDMRERIFSARNIFFFDESVDSPEKTARNKWEFLKEVGNGNINFGLANISDVRVAPLIQSTWDQQEADGTSNACYNYYTPRRNPAGTGPVILWDSGNVANYHSGCVATAMAQVMRYHQHPTTGVGTASFSITVDTESVNRNLRGSDGAGAAYNYANMPLVPGAATTDAQRQAIGALCYDAGLTVNMGYTSTGSGCNTLDTANAFVGTFSYSNAIRGFDGNAELGAGLTNMINPNLDSGRPTLLGISGNAGGHAIVCDGYGYNAGTMYRHLNMGWSGNDNAWYNFPTIDSNPDFNLIYKCVYNVFTTGNGEIISGRIVDGTGSAISGAVITATGTGGPFTDTSNADGIYNLDHVNPITTYSIVVTANGFTFTNRNETTGTSIDDQGTAGNLWGVDFIGTAVSTPPATPSISSPTSGQINVSQNPTLTSSNFSDPDVGDTHQSSDWEIHDAATPNATSTVWSKSSDTVNLISIDVSSTSGTFANALSGLTSLNASVQYWVRVRHKDNNGSSSSWSTLVDFTTLSIGNPPAKPTITSPFDGQTDVSSTVTVTGSAFSDPDVGDTLSISEWEIHDSLNTSSITLVFNKANWTSTSIQVNTANGNFLNCLLNQANLGNFNDYWVKVRYYDNNGLASEWSDMVSFQTTSTGITRPVQPNVLTPPSFQSDVSVTPTLSGTPFSDVISGHLRTCWEIFDQANFNPTSRVWSKYNELVNLENIIVNSTNGTFENSLSGLTQLSNATMYWVRIKYYNDVSASSTWSAVSSFTTLVSALPPNKPSIVSPTAGEINIAINPDVTGSGFSDPDIGDTHLQSDWEVYNSSVITPANRVWFKLGDTVNLVSITINGTNGTYENALAGQTSFALNTQYWVRVKHYDASSNPSEWSDTQNFTTVVFSSSPPDKPVVSDPTAGATDLITNPPITSSAFNDSDPFDTHLRTDWEIYDNATLGPSNRVWFNTGDTVNFTSTIADSVHGQFENARLGQSDLSNGTAYWLRVRYIDNSFTPSEWSDVINFTTLTAVSANPVKPSIISPTSGQNDLAVNPDISGNAFSDPDVGNTHKQTDWELYTGSTPVASERVWYKFNDTTYLITSRIDPSHGIFENALLGASYLAYNTPYFVRVRYSDNTDVYSDWSDMIGFTTSTTLNNVPNAPTIISPVADAIGIDPNAPIGGSNFADPDPGDSHFETDWEVYDNPSLFSTNLVWSSSDNPLNLTSITVETTYGIFSNALSGQTSLAYLSDYYTRLRYQDNLGNVSTWSGIVKFTTGEQPNNRPDKPTITSPTDLQVNVDINLDIVTSAFNDPDAGDTHKGTDWKIYDNVMTDPANLVWSSLIDTVKLTTTKVDSTNGTFSNALSGQSALGYLTDYWIIVRYHDSRDMTTEWSDIIAFKTRSTSVNAPNKPQITYPTSDLTGVVRNVKSTASAFSDADVADTHQKTDWRIYDNQSLESTSIVWECMNNTTELIVVDVAQPPGVFINALAGQTMLNANTEYWINVRYFDNNSVASEWADAIHFTTGSSTTPSKPFIIVPPPNQRGIDINQIIVSSNFFDLNTTETHLKSDWEVYDDTGVPYAPYGLEAVAGSRIWSKIGDTVNLTFIKINARNGTFENSHSGLTGLNFGTNYWFRVKYYDNSSDESEWSDMAMFTTGHIGNIIHTDEAYIPFDNDTHLLFTWEVDSSGIPFFGHYNIYAAQDLSAFPLTPNTTSTDPDHFTLEVGTGNIYGFLGHGHSYRLVVQVVSTTGELGMSIEARSAVDSDVTQIFVDTVAPYQPIVTHDNELNVLYDDDKKVEFSWTPFPDNDDPLNGALFSQYEIFQKVNDSEIQFVKLTKNSFFSFENASNLFSYEVLVVPFDLCGNKGMTGAFGPVWVINEAPLSPEAPAHSDDAPAGYDDDYFLYFSWSKQIPKTISQVNIFMKADGPVLTNSVHNMLNVSALSTDPGFTLDVVPGVIGFDPQGKKFGVKAQFIAFSGITSEVSFTSTPYPVRVLIGVPNQPNQPVLSEETLNPPYIGRKAKFEWFRKTDSLEIASYNVVFQRTNLGSVSPEVTYILSALQPPGHWMSFEIDGLTDSITEPGVNKLLTEENHIKCRIQSVSMTGRISDFSPWSSDAVVDLYPPSKPLILEYLPNPVDADTISITLTAPARDTHPPVIYQIQGTAYSSWQNITGPPFIVTMLQNQGNYIRIRGVDAAGRISLHDDIYITESSLGPSQPGQPIHSDLDAPEPWDNDQNLDFTWQPPASGVISQYRFYINIDGERGTSGETIWNLVGSTDRKNYTYGAPYGGEHHFYQARIEAIDSLGRSTIGPSSSVVFVDVVPPRPAPIIDKTSLWFDGNTGIATSYGNTQILKLSQLVFTDENGFVYQIKGGKNAEWTETRPDVYNQFVYKLNMDVLNILEVRSVDPARNSTAVDKVHVLALAQDPPQPSEPIHHDDDANPGYDNDTELDFAWENVKENFQYLNSYIVYLSINSRPYQYYREVFTNAVVVNALEENIYQIKVKSKDIFSNLGLYSPVSLPIIVDISPAKILKSSLNDGDVFVATTTLVEITFDEPMDSGSILKRGNIRLVDQNNVEIEGKLVYDETSNKLTFTPYDDLKHDYDYKFIISIDVKDIAGNKFDNETIIGFHTIPPDGLKIMKLLNYPNPISNAGTTFSYYLSQDSFEVIIKIYSTSGKKLCSIENCPADEGYNEVFWDGVDEWGSTLPNGTYIVMATVYGNEKKNSIRTKISVLK